MADEESKETPEFLHLNNQKSIVPPMKNVVGDTYAETKAEIEARKRAEALAEMAKMEAATPAPVEPPKKSSIWFSVLTILFLLIALAGVGFGVFEYTQNETLKENYEKLESDYLTVKDERDSLKENYDVLKSAYDKLIINQPTESTEDASNAENSESSSVVDDSVL